MIRSFLFFLLILLATKADAQFYNGSVMDFGKNRIQYKPIEWSFYRYERFDVFFFAGGKDLSERVARTVRYSLPEYEEFFDYTLENRIQFLVCDRLSNLKQTNVGLGSKGINLGGTTNLVDSKILVYYDQSTAEFIEQVRAGLAESLVNEFLYGADFRERLRSSTLMNVPEWYRKGLVAYLSRSWKSETEDLVRDGILSGRYFKFNRLEGEDAIVAGESIWHYIAATYGHKVIMDIVEMTRLTRSVENGFHYVLGIGLKGVTQEWINYYDKQYYPTKDLFADLKGDKLSKKNRRKLKFHSPNMSRNGRYRTYVSNESGKSFIRIFDTQKQKLKAKIKMGRRLPTMNDLSFPKIAWHPNNNLLLYTDEFRGRLRLNYYDVAKGETERKFIDKVQKIMHMEVSPNGREIAMIALQDGKCDLFVFNNIANTFEAYTKDEWDESGATWTSDGESIVFSSNRPVDSLKTASAFPDSPVLTNDLFQVYTSSRRLKRLTKTSRVNEQSPQTTGKGTLAYLSDANGLNNVYTANFDSTIIAVDTAIHYNYYLVSKPITNVNRGIRSFSIQGDNLLSVQSQFNKQSVILSSISETSRGIQEKLPLTPWAPSDRILPQENRFEKKAESAKPKSKIKKIIVFGNGEPSTKELEITEFNSDTSTFKRSRQRLYETSYYPEFIVTRIDRGFLNQTYQPYSPGGYINPSVNGLFRFAIADLFEDYRLTGGFRLAGNLQGNEYLLAFESSKKRMDHSFVFHRQGLQAGIQAGSRVLLHTLAAKVSYPFSEVARIDGSIAYRNDRTVYVSSDLANLSRPNEFKHWANAKTEFVWDNSFPVGLNMFTGMRAKATLEHFYRLDAKKTHVTIAGFDVRNYGRITREMIWATRVAGATSFGPNKVLFYLGGVDNWFIPRFDQTTSIDQSQNYLFQTLGTNVRGFIQNIRNGSSFGVVNTEVRWNFLRYMFNYPLRSDFFNSMQMIGFADVGTAFTGKSPYSDDNTFNQKTIQSGPITVILKNQRDPVVAGLGMGIRSRILGYFIRVDVAKGIEDRSFLPSVVYLSLATDF
jgi:Tol biopolymer transport system component